MSYNPHSRYATLLLHHYAPSGDRDVDITLQRLASAISNVDGDRVAALMDRMTVAEGELGLTLGGGDATGGVKKVCVCVYVCMCIWVAGWKGVVGVLVC
jgi:hypothetical protein